MGFRRRRFRQDQPCSTCGPGGQAAASASKLGTGIESGIEIGIGLSVGCRLSAIGLSGYRAIGLSAIGYQAIRLSVYRAIGLSAIAAMPGSILGFGFYLYQAHDIFMFQWSAALKVKSGIGIIIIGINQRPRTSNVPDQDDSHICKYSSPTPYTTPEAIQSYKESREPNRGPRGEGL